MTIEEKWFACRDVWDIIHKFLPSRFLGKAGERKLRLFACACCRRQWQHIEGTAAAAAIEVAERFADGLASVPELNSAQDAAGQHQNANFVAWEGEVRPEYPAHYTAAACVYAATDSVETSEYHVLARGAAVFTAQVAAYVQRGFLRISDPAWDKYKAEENAAQTALFREIFGNPFRSTVVDPEWRTTTVMQLARGIYESRDYATMPILADALQDAGCTANELLKHLRDAKATHVRGCWALDLVLGKE